jgi:hypothetical protein
MLCYAADGLFLRFIFRAKYVYSQPVTSSVCT